MNPDYNIKSMVIDNYFKEYYENYIFFSINNCNQFKGGYSDQIGIEKPYKGYFFYYEEHSFIGLFDKNNNLFIDPINAYESSILTFNDLIEVATFEGEAFNYDSIDKSYKED